MIRYSQFITHLHIHISFGRGCPCYAYRYYRYSPLSELGVEASLFSSTHTSWYLSSFASLLFLNLDLADSIFTVDTLFSQTIYVLFFIELGTCRCYFAGCTPHPTKAWVTQQARQLTWQLADKAVPIKFLIHDRSKLCLPSILFFRLPTFTSFRHRFAHQMQTPLPNVVRAVRRECLNKLIIVNEVHLRWVLKISQVYNTACHRPNTFLVCVLASARWRIARRPRPATPAARRGGPAASPPCRSTTACAAACSAEDRR